MANAITAAGITIETYSQIISNIQNGTSSAPGFYQIYGSNINLASNSPDGNMINIFALSKQDMLNLCVATYNSFDPDQAIGIALDNISQIASISRKSGTYTSVVVAVIVGLSLNLNGLDLVYGTTPFTIQDGNGNQYNLVTSISLTAGTYNLNFQSAAIGAIQCLANTLTTPVTIIAGVTSVNNPSAGITGLNQETDANFRLRRQASTSFPSLGALNGIYAGLNQLSGVIGAAVYENVTSSPVNGIPANGIWAVVNGGTPSQIAQVIYNRRTLGCPMKGSQTYVITQADASTITMKWDTAVAQSLYVYGFIHSLTGNAVNISAISAYLIANWIFGIYQEADISTLNNLILQAQPGVVCTGLGVSTSGAYYTSFVLPSSQQNYFTLSLANINLTVD